MNGEAARSLDGMGMATFGEAVVLEVGNQFLPERHAWFVFALLRLAHGSTWRRARESRVKYLSSLACTLVSILAVVRFYTRRSRARPEGGRSSHLAMRLVWLLVNRLLGGTALEYDGSRSTELFTTGLLPFSVLQD